MVVVVVWLLPVGVRHWGVRWRGSLPRVNRRLVVALHFPHAIGTCMVSWVVEA